MNSLIKPEAIIFDLDDTLIVSDATVEQSWREACAIYAEKNPPVDAETIRQKIREVAIWFWSDPDRHREGRNAMDKTRNDIILKALEELNIDDKEGAKEMSLWFSNRRFELIDFFPGALDLLVSVRAAGIKLGMLTNGESVMQRRKIDQFKLEPYFDVIQVEGEAGVGKPEPEAYKKILKSLGVTADQAWIVGDNLEWEVIVPKKLGITAIWHNYYGKELPQDTIAPDRTLSEIKELAPILNEVLRDRSKTTSHRAFT